MSRERSMKVQQNYKELGCKECIGGSALGFDFSMALQPIVNTTTKQVFAQEALVRGLNNEPAGMIFENVNESNRYRFDQTCRVKAIKLAADLALDSLLSINFMPNAVYRPELCIRTTLEAAVQYGFPVQHIIFEVTESEKVDDHAHLRDIVQHYKERGFKTAIDDFGAGHSGLNLLAEMQTDYIKIDMALVRNIDQDKFRQAIVKGIIQVSNDIGSIVISEGIESKAELETLQSFGLELFQGYYFAKPAFQSIANIHWDE